MPKRKTRGRIPRRWQLRLGRLLRITLMALAALVAVGSFLAVAYVTLTPSPQSVPESHPNLDPGETIRIYLDQPSVRAAILQIGGNMLLFMPLGILVPIAAKPLRGPVRVLAAIGLLSLLVELTQGFLAVGRSFDIDDVIMNTAGAVIGYVLVGRPLARWVHSRGTRPRRKSRKTAASRRSRA